MTEPFRPPDQPVDRQILGPDSTFFTREQFSEAQLAWLKKVAGMSDREFRRELRRHLNEEEAQDATTKSPGALEALRTIIRVAFGKDDTTAIKPPTPVEPPAPDAPTAR